MGNSITIVSYDRKVKMNESLIKWLIKEFGNNKNIIFRAPGVGYLVSTMKEFKGQKHYYYLYFD